MGPDTWFNPSCSLPPMPFLNSSTLPVTLTDLSKMIDHSLLHPTMTDDEIKAGLELAKK